MCTIPSLVSVHCSALFGVDCFFLLHFLCSEVSSYYIDLFSKDFFCFLSFIFLFWHILNLNEDIRRLSKVQQLKMRLIFVFFERKDSNICWSLTSTETFGEGTCGFRQLVHVYIYTHWIRIYGYGSSTWACFAVGIPILSHISRLFLLSSCDNLWKIRNFSFGDQNYNRNFYDLIN